MTRHASFTIRFGAQSLALIAAALACVALTMPALAGINPLKKAKDAVTKSSKPTEPPKGKDEPPVFDEYTLELTEARIKAIIAACQKATDAATKRQAIVDTLNRVQDQRGKLDEKEGEKVRELQRKRGDVEVCYHDEYQKYIEQRRSELSSKALSDPSSMQDLTKLLQEYSMASAKGDTATANRASVAMLKWGAPTHDDTLAVRRKCGPIPPHSAAEDQLAAYDKQIEGLNQRLRQADERAAKEQSKAIGMSEEQWGIARERLLGFSYKDGSASGSRGFSDDEMDALEKYGEQLAEAHKNGCF